MQNALQNPHYKKIWEKVITNRHPEAKSLYSALMYESDEYCAYGVVMHARSHDYGQLKMFRDMYKIDKQRTTERPEIIGRPITLEDILLLLPHHCFVNGCIMVCYKVSDGSFHTGYNNKIKWQLTKHLHEQTPETWERINLIIYETKNTY